MKKIIFIGLAAGLVGFSGMFAFAWFTAPAPAEPDPAGLLADAGLPGAVPAVNLPPRIQMAGSQRKTMTDQQLESLVYEVREKIKEYNFKLQELEVREERLQAAQDVLKKDIEEMTNLRVELSMAVASLKNEQENLLKSKVEIEAAETTNLIAIAASYDKMDSESAAKILMNMAKTQVDNAETSDDAVKILYYMTERTKGKVLASMAEAEPNVSAYFCQKLKRMIVK